MRAARAIIISTRRALGLAEPAGAAPHAPATPVRPAPASPHLLYHG
jgi:hypothetical protein